MSAGAAPAAPAKAASSVPVPMPGGGVRLDMRGSTTNVRTLEKQADGTYKQTCTDVPVINQPANQPVKP